MKEQLYLHKTSINQPNAAQSAENAKIIGTSLTPKSEYRN